MAADPRRVVFDLDDTLYLERDYVQSGFEAVDALVLARFGRSGFGAAAWDLFERGRRGDIFNLALGALGVEGSPKRIAELVEAYRAHRPAIRPAADAVHALAAFSKKAPLGLISDGVLIGQRLKLEALGIECFFEAIVLNDRWGRAYWKPHERGFREIERLLGGVEFVFVGDNPAKDFVAPRRLGWRTVRIRRPQGIYLGERSPAEGEAEREIESLAELADALDGR